MATDAWADKMLEVHAGEPEKFAKLMMHISDNPKHQLPLSKLAKVDTAFKTYLDHMSVEINGTLAQYLDETQLVAEDSNGFQVGEHEVCTMFNATGTAVLARLPPEHTAKVLHAFTVSLKKSDSETVRSLGGELSELGRHRLRRYAMYGSVSLLAVKLSWEAIGSMHDWWQGKISGKRAAKKVVDCMGSLGSGCAAGGAGFMIGSTAGAWGAVTGAVIGSVVGSMVGASFTDKLTQWFFDIPKDAALENAYKFLEVHHDSDNPTVNKRFKELCLKYHPDKLGNAEDFHKLQVSMQVIKLAREQT
mmetsp:Transcript_59954/g.104899  ORF Transcript_59954/g.104899 Transcript_59954/m.104899 type:complete len:304 (-) Transcript_59954:217-1128(-)